MNGFGLKKPRNQLENPIYPDIKKGPPRFVWSRKHWNVDVGATLRDTEPITQFYEPAILAQSRDYNRTVYGQSSHKDIVNAEFRPPLQSYYEDIGPLSRVPATIHAIIPHINPGTAGHGGGTSGYTAKNERTADVVGALSDRVSGGQWRPTFYAPIDIPMDNSILPDLEAKLPPVSAHAGWEIPIFIAPQPREIELDSKLGEVPITPTYQPQVRLNAPNRNFEGVESLPDNRPTVSVTAGMNTPVKLNMETNVENFVLENNRPVYSATAGINTPVNLNAETQVPILEYTRPQVSVTAGMNNPVLINAETVVPIYNKKLGGVDLRVANPGTETGYKTRNNTGLRTDNYTQTKRPNYSYVVPKVIPAYRSRNEQSHQPHFRQRLQPLKSYGQIAQSGGAIPRMGIEQPRTFRRRKTRNPLASQKKKAVYSF